MKGKHENFAGKAALLMILEISVAVIAVCVVVMTLRVYTLSIRAEETMRRWEEFMLRMENDIRPVLYDAKEVLNHVKGVVEIAKDGTRRVSDAIEVVLGPIQTLGVIMKAIKAGPKTFFKRKGGDYHGFGLWKGG